jgi:hypothetical protein
MGQNFISNHSAFRNKRKSWMSYAWIRLTLLSLLPCLGLTLANLSLHPRYWRFFSSPPLIALPRLSLCRLRSGSKVAVILSLSSYIILPWLSPCCLRSGSKVAVILFFPLTLSCLGLALPLAVWVQGSSYLFLSSYIILPRLSPAACGLSPR